VIREATLDDLDEIVRMGGRFYESTSYSKWSPFCPASARDLGEMLVETGVVLIAERGGQPVGMAGLVVSPFMFNRDVLGAYEVFWWMEPEARGGIVAWSLLKAIEPACRRRGCAMVQMTTLHDSPPQAVEMYRRAGYSHTETSFTKIIGSQ
jgi:GNAT superfamily N-acetyltransferase